MYKRIKSALPDEMHIRRNPHESIRNPFEVVFRSSQRYISALHYFWHQHLQRPLTESTMVVPAFTNIPHSFFEEIEIQFVDESLRYQTDVSGNGILTHHPVGFFQKWFCLRRHRQHRQHRRHRHSLTNTRPILTNTDLNARLLDSETRIEPSAPPMPLLSIKCEEYECDVKENVCSICLSNETFMKTQCGHHYCSCLLEAVTQYDNDICPLCRSKVVEITIKTRQVYESIRACNSQDYQFQN
jgi:hypothetical protein